MKRGGQRVPGRGGSLIKGEEVRREGERGELSVWQAQAEYKAGTTKAKVVSRV